VTAIQFLLRRRRRNIFRSCACAMLSLALFATGSVYDQPVVTILGAIGIVIGLVVEKRQRFLGAPCPACGGNLALFLNYRNALLPTERRIHFCPYCGGDLDEIEVPEPVSTSTSDDRP
jgi:uncharacterized membrane protein